MDEDKPKNIFEAAAASRPKKKPLAPSQGMAIPAPKEREISRNEPVFEGSAELIHMHRDPDINQMLNKMYRMQDDLQSRLTQIYDENSISSNQVKNFLDNPSNFPPEVWQKIQNQRDSLENKIGAVLKTYARKKKKGIIGMNQKEGVSKERKSKTLGSRRNWIPM